MTAKELLHERIETLSEAECVRLLNSIPGDPRTLLTPEHWNAESLGERETRIERALEFFEDLREDTSEDSVFPDDWPTCIERTRLGTANQW